MRNLHSELLIELSIERVFNFFSKPENLGKVTPDSMDFKIVTPLPIHVQEGSIIEYRIKVIGIPMQWVTKITKWNPPFEFQDTQIQGPYRMWVHTHSFEVVEGGTLMRDHIEYLPPGCFFEPIVHKLFVGPQVRKIFKYRKENFRAIFSQMKNND